MHLNLRAGNLIHIKPGTHFMAGSTVHAQIEYWPCHIEIEDFEPIIPDPWGNGGGMLEPIPQEDENKCVLAKNIDDSTDQENQTDFDEVLCNIPQNDQPNESDIDLKLVAIKENEVEFKTLIL